MSAQDYLQGLTYSAQECNSDDRLRELVLYVAGRSIDDPRFGAVKLNKILYFADFKSFARYGKSITGAGYMRLDEGPVPVRMVPIRRKMIADREIALIKVRYYDHDQHRVMPLRDANLDCFKAQDIALVDDVISWLYEKSGAEVSKLSHGRAWNMAEDKQNIPYEAVFISDEGLTDYDIARSRELIHEHGWDV
jgi:hypothetical protein